MGYAWFKHPFYIFLLAVYLFLVPGTITAYSDFYEFEPIMFFILFGIFSATDNIRVVAIIGVKKKEKLCEPRYYYKLTLLSTFAFMVLMAVYYYTVRTLFFEKFLPLTHLPDYINYYPWLYIAYASNALFFINSNMLLIYLSDLIKVKKFLVDEIPSTIRGSFEFIKGKDNAVAGFFLGYGVGLGSAIYAFPIYYIIDVIKGNTIASSPIFYFVTQVLMVYSIVTLAISLFIFCYLTYKILRGDYFHRLMNCVKDSNETNSSRIREGKDDDCCSSS